jgi:hypothetical protein
MVHNSFGKKHKRVGGLRGKVHAGPQDLGILQTWEMKGLKGGVAAAGQENEDRPKKCNPELLSFHPITEYLILLY